MTLGLESESSSCLRQHEINVADYPHGSEQMFWRGYRPAAAGQRMIDGLFACPQG